MWKKVVGMGGLLCKISLPRVKWVSCDSGWRPELLSTRASQVLDSPAAGFTDIRTPGEVYLPTYVRMSRFLGGGGIAISLCGCLGFKKYKRFCIKGMTRGQEKDFKIVDERGACDDNICAVGVVK